jgi:hypothetical protein
LNRQAVIDRNLTARVKTSCFSLSAPLGTFDKQGTRCPQLVSNFVIHNSLPIVHNIIMPQNPHIAEVSTRTLQTT